MSTEADIAAIDAWVRLCGKLHATKLGEHIWIVSPINGPPQLWPVQAHTIRLLEWSTNRPKRDPVFDKDTDDLIWRTGDQYMFYVGQDNLVREVLSTSRGNALIAMLSRG